MIHYDLSHALFLGATIINLGGIITIAMMIRKLHKQYRNDLLKFYGAMFDSHMKLSAYISQLLTGKEKKK